VEFEDLYLIEWGIRVSMGPVIVLRRGSPSAALAWLVVVFMLPVFGTIAYFLVGESRLGVKRSSRHRDMVRRLSGVLGKTISESYVATSDLRPSHQLISSLASGLGGSSTVSGSELVLIQEAEDLCHRLVTDIDAATDHCHLLYYIFNNDSVGRRVGEALIRASSRGVKCRLLVDGVGSKVLFRRPLWADLRNAGVHLAIALPVNPVRAIVARLDLRNHRKLAVIDGRIAYTGSHNVSEALYPKKERFGAWVDASVRVTGPAVQLLQEIFLQDWYASGAELVLDDPFFPQIPPSSGTDVRLQILPTGPGQFDAPMEKVILQAVHIAQRRIVMTTPYFVPDDPLVDALRAAAVRGVEVSLVLPKRSDAPVVQAAGRARYGELLEAGLQIFEFTRGLLHAKTITVDGDFALIGSANLDIRSFLLNFELALLVYDDDFASRVHFLQRAYIEESDPVRYADWRRRGAWRILIDNISKLMSPLL